MSCTWYLSVRECRLDERTQPAVAECQNNRGHCNEDDVGKTSNDQKILCRRAPVVVEIVDRDNASSPRYYEEHYESENHLQKHKTMN